MHFLLYSLSCESRLKSDGFQTPFLTERKQGFLFILVKSSSAIIITICLFNYILKNVGVSALWQYIRNTVQKR